MRKMILALMLAIASSVWMINEASNWCMPSVRTLTEPWIEVNGTFQAEGFPCEPDELCPPCLTIVLVTSDKTYYLVTDDGQLIEYLDTIPLGTKATVSGIPFEHGSYDYIQVSHIETDQKLPSLCDEWNVLEISNVTCGYCEEYRTYNFHLTTDTVIGGIRYTQLVEDDAYRGALREGLNRDIYYIPAGCAHEYLLYAFNAQEGDQLTNLWIGGSPADSPDGWAMTVEEIQETTPRTFVLSTGYTHTDEGIENYPLYITWIEGVGMDGPVGDKRCVGCADSRAYGVLCAYKNGEHIYTSDLGEQYGCVYNRHTFNYLCDEWNVLHETFSWPGGYNTFKYFLSTDTIINGKQYVKLASDKDYPYCGAFREDNNANIYYIPSGSTHEYLIYAFNAQVGDTLSNLWVGGFGEDYQGVVQAISNGSPRIFIIGVKFYENSEYYSPIRWIEGVGSPETPMGLAVVPTVPADIGVFNLLCAYKNGQQVYATQLSEQFGCFYEGHNPPPTADTIPLYAQDDPGSSTVDPVDPNQVVATLQGDQLTIHENMGIDITYSLNHEAPAQMPSQYKAPLSNTFRDEVTIQITQSGEYLLQLTNPSWGYTIYGRFYYSPQGIDQIESSSLQGGDRGRLILLNGQLFILRGEKTYTLQGQEVK